jgi:hypothetical protein
MGANQPSSRQWVIENSYDPETGELLSSVDQQAAFRLQRLAIVLADIGGTLAVVADREEVQPGIYVTTRIVIRWESFAPARRPRAVAEPEPEPVEAEAESLEHEPEPEPEPAAA